MYQSIQSSLQFRNRDPHLLITYFKGSACSDWLIHAIHLPLGSKLKSSSLFCWQFWYVVFRICYKRNGKHRSCVYIELMHLRDLLSTQEARVAYDSYTSFMLSNLQHASRTRCTLRVNHFLIILSKDCFAVHSHMQFGHVYCPQQRQTFRLFHRLIPFKMLVLFHSLEVGSHQDDEYAWAGIQDPKIMITTSHNPSSRLKQFAKVKKKHSY